MNIFSHFRRRRHDEGFILVLGGGGGRGLAHLGVLEVLQERHLKPDAIVGTSMGALVGAMYGLQPDAEQCIEQTLSFLKSDMFVKVKLPVMSQSIDEAWYDRLVAFAHQSLLFAKVVNGISVADVALLSKIVAFFCDGHDFADLKIPVYVTAVHYPTGECRLFSQADKVSLTKAVAASMAIPSVFDPVLIQGERYVDGGVVSEIPVVEAKSIAHPRQCVVAINVGARPSENFEAKNILEMMDWSINTKSLYLRAHSKNYADILIEPLVGFTQWHDFSKPEDEIEKGRQAARQMLPTLLRRLGRS